MSTFKTALRMALAHPFYLLIYTVFISLMGVFIAASVSWNSSQLTEYEPYDTNMIVVDRDDSDLSRALTKHLGSRFDLVTGVGSEQSHEMDAEYIRRVTEDIPAALGGAYRVAVDGAGGVAGQDGGHS